MARAPGLLQGAGVGDQRARLAGNQVAGVLQEPDGIAVPPGLGTDHPQKQARLRAGLGNSEQLLEVGFGGLEAPEVELRDRQVLSSRHEFRRDPQSALEVGDGRFGLVPDAEDGADHVESREVVRIPFEHAPELSESLVDTACPKMLEPGRAVCGMDQGDCRRKDCKQESTEERPPR